MKKAGLLLTAIFFIGGNIYSQDTTAWIRINQLGYKPGNSKVAVWCAKEQKAISKFSVVDVKSGKTVYEGNAGKAFGAYGPFVQTYRLNFSDVKKAGVYIIKAGDAASPEFRIGEDVYNGAADFCLRYMRQQRCGFNPFLNDSCHTHDGYTMYGPMPDSTHIDVTGGWHDASDYLQYVTTSANATWHLLAAYRDFPKVFSDQHQSNGLSGTNGRADVLDEAKWGLDWLLKMHPTDDWMFNQIADDRDHQGMRIPKEDSFYGKGFERPVYFCTGEPQGLFKYKNRATGVASTAGKMAAAFALGYEMLGDARSFYQAFKDLTPHNYGDSLFFKALSAYGLGRDKPGICQTAPGRSPYFYEEDNWKDDMALAGASIYSMARFVSMNHMHSYLTDALNFAHQEKITPWLGNDTARHYQWYPFINLGHYELAKKLRGRERDIIAGFYREGMERVWNKAKQNAFFRGIPFIWCSNNLTTSFAIQCYWYKQLTGDDSYTELEQANFDWLFGCNPWGTGMVYGLPSWGDTPADPHSAFTHLKNYPIDGGLVDGPVYGSIYNNLIGITLYEPDEYAAFQSNLAVYHDDYGDYSTNEPTMDGTASLIYLLAAKEAEQHKKKADTELPVPVTNANRHFSYSHGAIIRGDSTQKQVALVFTGHEFADGGAHIAQVLKQQQVKASFFFTGNFYRNRAHRSLIKTLKKQGHYLGAHSGKHLLYCDWTNRDSLLITREEFSRDLRYNYKQMRSFGIEKTDAPFFLPPYEWYNYSIAVWTKEQNLQLINFTPGTSSNADYTTPAMKNYRSSAAIYDAVLQYEKNAYSGLNGFILLLHIGTDPARTDKFYLLLPRLVTTLLERGYRFVTVDQLLQ